MGRKHSVQCVNSPTGGQNPPVARPRPGGCPCTDTGIALLTLVAAFALAALAGCGGSTSATTGGGGAAATTGAAAIDAKALFQATCAACHGADGTGGTGPNLVQRGPTLTLERITDQITNGGAQMPPYGSQYSADEIEALATYVNGGLK